MHLIDLTIFYAPKSGGVKTYLEAKAAWVAKETHIRHTIIAPRWHDDASFIGVPGVPIPFTNGHRMPLSIKTSACTLQDLHPDCIEVEDPYQFAWAALQVRRQTKIPVVAYYHSDLPRLIRQRLGIFAERAATQYIKHLYRQFDLVLAPSQYIAQKLSDIGISQVRYQPLGVDTQIFSPERFDNNLRSRLGLAEDVRLLVYAGRFTKEKDLPLLIKAVERLGDPYHLLMVGDGRKLPKSSRVTHLPFQHDAHALATLIASCDVLIHPGAQETFGLIVLEAMSCGIPVLGMKAGGVAELIDDDTGISVKPDNVKALMEGINNIYECDLATLGINARRKVQEKYDWGQIMPQFMTQYASLFSTKRQRDELNSAEAAYVSD
ncbi:MAG: glycosyltransferase [Burkholderiaceae bacterium]